MVNAKRTLSLSTTSRTGSLEVNKRSIVSLKIIITNQNTKPITVDVITDTIVANFAPSPFPAPSSCATLTLGYSQASPKVNFFIFNNA